MTSGTLRAVLQDWDAAGSLATLDGIQFILPQTIAQGSPIGEDDGTEELPLVDDFDAEAPFRCVLLDGTPIAAHPALDGGIEIEDMHDLVERSQVRERHHATSMASLILRGDLQGDGHPLRDARVLSVPVLRDDGGEPRSDPDRLFIDVLHSTLARLYVGDEALAPGAFVINFSIGISRMRFAGRMSALARFIDWWSERYGVVFVISAGNIPDALTIAGTTTRDFEELDQHDRRKVVWDALRDSAYNRS